MPRNDDFDDDRPRRPRDDEDYDRPARRRRDDDYDRPPPRKKSNLGLVLGIVFGLLFLVCAGGAVAVYFAVKGAATKVTGAAERMNSSNNLKQIGLGCHEYTHKNGDFPSNSYGPDGRPLLSWRVHILPHIEQEGLYRQFKLDEPWDSPNNIRLLNQMPGTYGTPAEQAGRTPRGTKTYYRGISSPGAVFARRGGQPEDKGGPPLALERKLTLDRFQDGLSRTAVALEAGDAVEWTRPDDLDFSPGRPLPALGGVRPTEDNVLVLFGDGSVRTVKKANSEAQWRAAATYAGNEPLELD